MMDNSTKAESTNREWVVENNIICICNSMFWCVINRMSNVLDDGELSRGEAE